MIILAQTVPPDDIGVFYLVLSILGLINLVEDFGTVHMLSRYVPFLYGKKEWTKLRETVDLSIIGGGILATTFVVLLFAFSNNIAEMIGQPVVGPVLKVMSMWLLLKEIDDICRGVLEGRKKLKYSRGLLALQNFGKLSITLLAFYLIGFNIDALMIGYLLSFVIFLPLAGYYCIKEIRTWEKPEKRTVSQKIEFGKEIFTFGAIVSVISFLWMAIQYIDRIMIGFLLPDSMGELAIYTIAIGLANLILIFPMAISSIFFPLVSELFGKGDKKGMESTLEFSIKWVIIITFPIVILMGIFGKPLLGLFYGDFYIQGSNVLSIFVYGLFIRSIFSLPQLTLSAIRRLDVELVCIGVAVLINIVLNFVLIPYMGIDGAALASMVSLIVLGLLIFYYSNKLFGFTFPEDGFKPILAGLIVWAIMFIVEPVVDNAINYVNGFGGMDEIVFGLIKLVLLGIIFGVICLIYGTLLVIVKTFNDEEIALTKKLVLSKVRR